MLLTQVTHNLQIFQGKDDLNRSPIQTPAGVITDEVEQFMYSEIICVVS